MHTIKLLILTDHRNHSQVDSLYPMARAFARSAAFAEVWVASRSTPSNDPFFKEYQNVAIKGLKVDKTFTRERADELFAAANTDRKVSDFDVCLLRLPRPNPPAFFRFLGECIDERRLINRPSGILEVGSKAFLAQIPQFCPPLSLVYSEKEALDFLAQYDSVLKPLENSGGQGLLLAKEGRYWKQNEEVDRDHFISILRETVGKGYLMMKYLTQVGQGDKRTILANGEIVGSALRMPAADSWLCNASMGGISEYAEPDAAELEIAAKLGPILKEKGVVLWGFDTLVGDDGVRQLSEINASCVNGIYPAELHSGKPLIQKTVEALTDYIQKDILA